MQWYCLIAIILFFLQSFLQFYVFIIIIIIIIIMFSNIMFSFEYCYSKKGLNVLHVYTIFYIYLWTWDVIRFHKEHY